MADQPKIQFEVTLSGLVHVPGIDTYIFKSSINMDLDEGVTDAEVEAIIAKVLSLTLHKRLWRGGVK